LLGVELTIFKACSFLGSFDLDRSRLHGLIFTRRVEVLVQKKLIYRQTLSDLQDNDTGSFERVSGNAPRNIEIAAASG
jgi:hypothetical protein